MQEITDIAWFSNILHSQKLRLPQRGLGQGYSPYKFIEYDCPCGHKHTLKKNQYGFLARAGRLPDLSDPAFNYARPELFLGSDQILMSCSSLNGLVLVSVDKKFFNQSSRATHFVKHATLNRANKGFGLYVGSGPIDFHLTA